MSGDYSQTEARALAWMYEQAFLVHTLQKDSPMTNLTLYEHNVLLHLGGFETEPKLTPGAAFNQALEVLYARGLAEDYGPTDAGLKYLADNPIPPRFVLGDRVRKRTGSSWHGTVVGTYSTKLTPRGYCVESVLEHGSVQIYPEAALEKMA
jgi:hypothetical protein